MPNGGVRGCHARGGSRLMNGKCCKLQPQQRSRTHRASRVAQSGRRRVRETVNERWTCRAARPMLSPEHAMAGGHRRYESVGAVLRRRSQSRRADRTRRLRRCCTHGGGGVLARSRSGQRQRRRILTPGQRDPVGSSMRLRGHARTVARSDPSSLGQPCRVPRPFGVAAHCECYDGVHAATPGKGPQWTHRSG